MVTAEIAGNEFIGPPLGGYLFGVALVLPFAINGGTLAIAVALVDSIPSVSSAVEDQTVTDDHREAMLNFWVERMLHELEGKEVQVQPFLDQFARWTYGLMSYPHGWGGSTASANNFPQISMVVLDLLANQAEREFTTVPLSYVETLRECLSEAEDLLGMDGSLSDDLAAFIRILIAQVRIVLAGDLVMANFDLQSAIRNLNAAFGEAAQSSTQHQSRWEKIGVEVWSGALTGSFLEIIDFGRRALESATGINSWQERVRRGRAE